MAGKRQIADRPQAPALMCATAGCPYEARVKVRLHKAMWDRRKKKRLIGERFPKQNPLHIAFGPWLNLCYSCDDKRHRQESREYCELMGLDTPAKQKAWCLKQIKRGKNMLLPETVLREPGEDLGEELDDFHPATQA